MLYACDDKWWHRYHDEVKASGFAGELWTQDNRAAQRYRLNRVQGGNASGLGRRGINWGGNSGYQSINLAYLWGAVRILLIGFDMRKVDGRSHWFGDHPPGLHNNSPYDAWLKRFDSLAADLRAEQVDVLNCTPESALRAFPFASIDEVLKSSGA